MNTLRLSAVIFLASATTAACSGEQIKLEIRGHRAPCVGIAIGSCMVTESANGPSFFYDGIEGFEFKWGVDQTIIAEVTEIDDPPADGSSREYALVEILNTREIAAGERFSLTLATDYAAIEGSEFALPDGRRMACADSTLCDDVRARLGGTERFVVEVAHPADPKDASLPLEIVSVSDAS